MLKEEEVSIETGRAVGGDFLRIVHLPTGISRGMGPPLNTGRAMHEFKQRALREIEAELQQRGLTQHLLPDLPTKRWWPRQSPNT